MSFARRLLEGGRWRWLIWAPVAALAVVAWVRWIGWKGRDLVTGDGEFYYVYAASLVVDGDIDFTDDYPRFRLPEDRRTATGLAYNKYPVGVAVLAAPFYLVGHAVARAGNALGAGWRDDGWSPPEQVAFSVGCLAWALVGLELTFRIVRRFASERDAAIAATAAWLGTSLGYYTRYEPTFPHACSFFAVTAFLFYDLAREDESPRTGFFLGALAGLMTLVENQNVLVCVVPLLRRGRALASARGLAFTACGAAGALVAFAPQMAAWQVLFGRPIVYSYAGESFDFARPKILEILFSTNHGLITWTPLVGIALAGLLAAAGRRADVRPYVAAFAAYLYLNASWWCWWFGASFGSRKFASLAAVFALGIGLVLARASGRRWAYAALVAAIVALVAGNSLFELLYLKGEIPPAEPLTAAHVRTAVARLPRILGRMIGL